MAALFCAAFNFATNASYNQRAWRGTILNARGRCNLTYWEFPGYDHQMQDEAGASHIDEVMQRVSDWLLSKVSAEPSKGCSQPERLGRE